MDVPVNFYIDEEIKRDLKKIACLKGRGVTMTSLFTDGAKRTIRDNKKLLEES